MRTSAVPSLPPAVGELPCGSSIQTLPDPPGDYRVVVQNVAVPTASLLQTSETGETDPAVRQFAKWVIIRSQGQEAHVRLGVGVPCAAASTS
jgi:hypothetical protein